MGIYKQNNFKLEHSSFEFPFLNTVARRVKCWLKTALRLAVQAKHQLNTGSDPYF